MSRVGGQSNVSLFTFQVLKVFGRAAIDTRLPAVLVGNGARVDILPGISPRELGFAGTPERGPLAQVVRAHG